MKSQKISDKVNTKKARAWIEINTENLEHNIEEIKRVLPDTTKLMAVVKANAYGHGDVLICKKLNQIGVYDFAVATLEEGIHLRQNHIMGDILVLGYTYPKNAGKLKKYDLIQTVFDERYANELNQQKKEIRVHIKIDTGMHRLGENCKAHKQIEEIFNYSHLDVKGMYTHLCVADSLEVEDVAYTKEQIKAFYDLVKYLKEKGYNTGKIHVQSSYGVLNYPNLQCDYARIGIAMYGVLSSNEDRINLKLDLKPVLSVKARIVMTKTIRKGEYVGYGRMFRAEKDMRIATVAIGYADGIDRSLSCGIGGAIVHGRKVAMIGRVCMDQLMLDITGVAKANQNDVITLLGEEGSLAIHAEDIAVSTNTITNELLSRLGNRLPRLCFHTE